MHATPTVRENGAVPGTGPERVFGREHRLRTRAQIARVRSEGNSRAGKYCVTVALPAPDGTRRLATIVSRRYSLKAVDRNRARRLLREAYRQTVPELTPAWILLIPRYRLKEAKLQDVLPEFRKHCRELGVSVAAERTERAGGTGP